MIRHRFNLDRICMVHADVNRRRRGNKQIDIMTCCPMCQWGGIVNTCFFPPLSTHFTVGLD